MPPEPAQPGRGDHHGVQLARGRPCRAGCRRCRGSARSAGPGRAPRAGRSGAASRCRPSRPAAARRAPCPSRATSASRGSSRGGTAAMTQPRVGRGRQVLVGVHGDVDLAGEQRVAQLRDEHADAERRDRGRRPVAVGADGDQLDGVARGAQPRRRPARTGRGPAALGRVPRRRGGRWADAVTGGPPRCRGARGSSTAVLTGASSAARTSPRRCTATAAGVCGSSSNSSRSACGVAVAVRARGQPLDLHRRGVQQLVDDPADGAGELLARPRGRARAAARRAAAARRRRPPTARRRSAVTVGVTSAERCAAR